MNKVVIITLGCKQNKYESDCMARILENNGYIVSENLEIADIYVLNTCAVTKEAEKKSRQYIAKFNKLNEKCKIIICGCASENNIHQFEDKKNVFSIFGTENKQNILDYINASIKNNVDIPKVYNSINCPKKTTTREYVKIQDGCNNFCSYCLIPYLRGRSRSRNIDEIVSECEEISKRSHEIVLTGIDISSYEVDGKKSLDLLMGKLSSINALIRLGSLEVGVISRTLLEVLSKMPNFAPHFHLSLQSGDDEILRKMNRHYTTDEYYEKVCLIREYFPDANITTDVIVGFAEETNLQFENTKRFIEKVGFSFVHIFPYSKREGTVAFKYHDLDMSIKKERVDFLEGVNEKLKIRYLSKFTHQTKRVLVEEKKDDFEGFTDNYIRCYIEDDVKCGEFVDVELIELYEDGFKCKKIN